MVTHIIWRRGGMQCPWMFSTMVI